MKLSIGDTYNQQGERLFTNQSATFIVGAGNFKGNSKPSDDVIQAIPAPNRKPDSSITYQTTLDQAAIYRYVLLSCVIYCFQILFGVLLDCQVTLIRCILIQTLPNWVDNQCQFYMGFVPLVSICSKPIIIDNFMSICFCL